MGIDKHKLRKKFPVTQSCIYLNNASDGPLPEPAKESMVRALENYTVNGQIPTPEWKRTLQDIRELASTLLNATPDEIAVLSNTTQGIHFAILSIPFKEGDNVVLIKDAFPANVYPWLNLLPNSVEKRFAHFSSHNTEKEILSLIDTNTRVVAVDWVHYLTGKRLNLKTIIQAKKHNPFLLLVDAIQGLGAMSLSVKGIDILVSGCSKWLLGPYGTAILYISHDTFNKLVPRPGGWLSLDWKNFDSFQHYPPPRNNTSFFEVATPHIIALYGMRENLKLITDIGISSIEEEIKKLRDFLIAKLRSLQNINIHSPIEWGKGSGIVTIQHPHIEKVQARLKQANIICSIREGKLRISPHFYNTTEEIEALIKNIA